MATTPTDRRTALARRIRLDIDTAVFPAVQYQQLMGVQELKLPEELRTETDESYDDAGAYREAVTGYSWRIEAKILHSTNAAGTNIDIVQAFLRSKYNLVKVSGLTSAEFGVRWYDRNGLSGDSFEGRAYVKSWPPEGGNPGALDLVSVVLQGQGALAEIVNPAASLVPVVTGLSPATGPAAGGTIINVYGTHFTGVTGAAGVKFGANNATSYMFVSDSHIVAVAPAGVAGTVQVSVTTPAGTSANVPADDYLYV